MPSPVRSIGERGSSQDQEITRTGRSSPQPFSGDEASTNEIREDAGRSKRDRSDFHPPQNQPTRRSRTHKIIRETSHLSSPHSSPFASSSRGGRGRRGTIVSSKEHEAAERAAREATSRHGESWRPTQPQSARSKISLPISSSPRSSSPDHSDRNYRMGYPSHRTAGTLSSPEAALYHGPVGSFQEDSPPRRRENEQEAVVTAERRSPPPPHQYVRHPGQPYVGYPPQHYRAHPSYHYPYAVYGYPPPGYPPHPSYYQPPPPIYDHQGYRDSQPAELQASPSTPIDWGSPPGISFSDSFGAVDSDRKAKNAPTHSFQPGSIGARDGSESSSSTPETKPSSKIGGNPFRSPVSNRNSTKSPIYQSSPNLSFSILDTPLGNQANDFSLMVPSFSKFADDLNSDDEAFTSGRLSLNRSSSDDDQSCRLPKIKQRPSKDKSPFAGLMDEFSPFPKALPTASPSGPPAIEAPTDGLQGVARSPMLTGSRSGHRHDSPSAMRIPFVTRDKSLSFQGDLKPQSISVPRHLTIRASPVAPSSEVKPRNLWQQKPGSAMRLTLGQVGTHMSMSSQQRSLEDINSMMRAQGEAMQVPRSSDLPTSSKSTSHGYEPQRHHPIPHGYYHGQPPYQHHALTTPIRGHVPVFHSASRGSLQHNMSYRPPSVVGSPPVIESEFKKRTPIASSSGKENSSNTSATTDVSQKKGICNCKKSKCLKLYCECFAAKRYCKGCNCKECHNTPEYESEREKAVKQALSKNRTAFEPRIAEEHNMGCKCRRSQCLKKYCECFQAGVLCSSRCKCSDCMNHAGSQKLIDVRRQMKDKKGAEYAMKINHETWKQGSSQSQSHLHMLHRPPIVTSPAAIGRSLNLPPHGHPTSSSLPGPASYARPTYFRPPMMGAIAYSPVSVNPVTPAVSSKKSANPANTPRDKRTTPLVASAIDTDFKAQPPSNKRTSQEITPSTTKKSRTPAIRAIFDPFSSRRKRKKGDVEKLFPYFGPKSPNQPKVTTLAIFSFLTNAELYKASLVCKSWNKLAMDEELWKFA